MRAIRLALSCAPNRGKDKNLKNYVLSRNNFVPSWWFYLCYNRLGVQQAGMENDSLERLEVTAHIEAAVVECVARVRSPLTGTSVPAVDGTRFYT